MKIKFCILSIVMGLSLVSANAFASVVAKDGYYVGANTGFGLIGTPRNSNDNLSAPDHHYIPVWGVYFGHKSALNPNSTVGWELGYNNNGSQFYQQEGLLSAGTLKFYSQDVDLLATYDYLWSNGFNVFAKAGVAYQMQKATATNDIVINGVARNAGSNTIKQFSPTMTIGAGYMLNENFDIYLAANYVYGEVQHNWGFSDSGNDYNNKAFEATSLRLGLNYNF